MRFRQYASGLSILNMQNHLPLRHPCEGRDLSLVDEIPAFGSVYLFIFLAFRYKMVPVWSGQRDVWCI